MFDIFKVEVINGVYFTNMSLMKVVVKIYGFSETMTFFKNLPIEYYIIQIAR